MKKKTLPVLVVLALAVGLILGNFGSCSGEGVFGYVYRPDTNVSVCYDIDGTPQWQEEGFAQGAFWPTVKSNAMTFVSNLQVSPQH